MPIAARFRVIGHRGNGAGPDENTLASCRRAIAAAADAVELDVRLRGSELILAHGRGRADSERLADVLPKLKCPVVLHLKRAWFSRRHDQRGLARLAKLRHKPGLTVSSFWPGTLRYATRRYPGLRTSFITYAAWWDIRFTRRLGVIELHAWHRSVTGQTARRARARGVKLIGFSAPWERRAIVRRQGIDGIITDYVSAYARPRASAGTRRRTVATTSAGRRSR